MVRKFRVTQSPEALVLLRLSPKKLAAEPVKMKLAV
jgi:hypothetical protein